LLRRPRPFDARRAADYPTVIGVDEVGRGALSGPVVVAAVLFAPPALPPELLGALDDSKKLTARRREALAAALRGEARCAFAAASAREVDRVGVRLATLSAMTRAVGRLGGEGPVVVDGRDAPPDLGARATTLIRGDSLVPQIAAASILAKVLRDRLMTCLSARHPDYDWDRNVGYGAPRHLAALRTLGATRHHRMSFAPVAHVAPVKI
jgi:ribonuclease HII